MGEAQFKIPTGEGGHISLSEEDKKRHETVKARSEQFKKTKSESDLDVLPIEDLGSEPISEEILLEAKRANDILAEAVKIINNKGLSRDQRVNLSREKLDTVSDGLKILETYKSNASSSGDEIRNAFIKKDMIDKFILG